jgi:hypothetical protein
MKEVLVLTTIILTILVPGYFLIGKPSFDAEAACAQKGGHLVRTYSDKVCAKLEVIK